ncbi:MAG: DUF6375 family protein, partial [Capsulimonas sp.]|uniref:DUF6375 family protein n=1 Tax=Capsulimonas sp. TaxID=2494211 RepID=UPI0032675F84
MKIWAGYGSEHSMNLVMIGRFKEMEKAIEAKSIIDAIKDTVEQAPRLVEDLKEPHAKRYSPEILAVLQTHNLFLVAPEELEQFAYDISVELKGQEIVVTTDESEVSAFLKVLID